MKFLFWLGSLLVALLLASFAVSNRAPVTLTLWPLPFARETPLYLPVLLALLFGFLIGAALAWASAGGRRREARRRGRQLRALQRELALTQAQLPGATASGASR